MSPSLLLSRDSDSGDKKKEKHMPIIAIDHITNFGDAVNDLIKSPLFLENGNVALIGITNHLQFHKKYKKDQSEFTVPSDWLVPK